jgi:hypothetical protein
MAPTLEDKLKTFDEYALEAVNFIEDNLYVNREEILIEARERHIEGHKKYGNGNFLEWDDERIGAEIVEELADAIVYATQLLYRWENNGRRDEVPTGTARPESRDS